MRSKWMSVCALVLILGGCGHSETKVTSGKPVSYWVKSLQTGNAKHRCKAVARLGNVWTTDPSVLPVVLKVLKDKDPTVRCEAILATVKNGRAARAAIPVLAELQQNDPNARVRSYAARAKAKLQGGT